MSMDEALIVAMCKVVVIGKVQSLVGETVIITDGSTQYTGVFGSDLVVTFDVWSTKKYTVTAGTFSEVIMVGSGQYVEVELGTFDRLWLVKDGDRYPNLSGIYQISTDNLSAHPRSETERVTYGSIIWAAGGAVWSNVAWDLTNYKTLWIKPALELLSIAGSFQFSIIATKALAWSASSARLYFNYCKPDKNGWYPIDVSDLNGLFFFRMEGSADGSSNNHGGLVEMFLAKDDVLPLIGRVATAAITGLFSGGQITASSYAGAQYYPSYALYYQDVQMNAWTQQMWLAAQTETTSAWLKITFDTAKKANLFRWDAPYNYQAATVKLQGSNNDTDWTDLVTITGMSATKSGKITPFKNDISYKYYRALMTNRVGSYFSCCGFQLYTYDNVGQVYKDLN